MVHTQNKRAVKAILATLFIMIIFTPPGIFQERNIVDDDQEMSEVANRIWYEYQQELNLSNAVTYTSATPAYLRKSGFLIPFGISANVNRMASDEDLLCAYKQQIELFVLARLFQLSRAISTGQQYPDEVIGIMKKFKVGRRALSGRNNKDEAIVTTLRELREFIQMEQEQIQVLRLRVPKNVFTLKDFTDVYVGRNLDHTKIRHESGRDFGLNSDVQVVSMERGILDIHLMREGQTIKVLFVGLSEP